METVAMESPSLSSSDTAPRRDVARRSDVARRGACPVVAAVCDRNRKQRPVSLHSNSIPRAPHNAVQALLLPNSYVLPRRH
ncbi:jg9239 [Pararge aegeria aegeria]|uniref:Jg9239 protein n=1 Tax=Pararge aegeria aegeria TaxID=348720 RepID=A0A8S4SN22_9NEOP|nr:jg9239 [Pararge aegeria aegeria]